MAISSRGEMGVGGGSRGGSGGGARKTTTGKAKAESFKENPFKQPAKNTGKLKYQGATKNTRSDVQALKKEMVKSGVKSTTGRTASKQEQTGKAKTRPNYAKEIDREKKVEKGQRTVAPKTPKVPVKKKGK
jgi:hypothetical protein